MMSDSSQGKTKLITLLFNLEILESQNESWIFNFVSCVVLVKLMSLACLCSIDCRT